MTPHPGGLQRAKTFTGKIKGFLGCFRRSLFSSGHYNFDQYLFVCLLPKPQNQLNQPLWDLVRLVSQKNYIDIMNTALGINDNGDVEDECDMAGCMEIED